MKRLGWQKSYREQEWQDTTNNLKFNNSNPFKMTSSLQQNTRSIYDNSHQMSEMLFKESQIWNPVGPPKMNTGDFGYLSSYSTAKRTAESKYKTFYGPQTPNRKANCWAMLSEDKIGLGKSGLPSLTDTRLGQQKLNNELMNINQALSPDKLSNNVLGIDPKKKDTVYARRTKRYSSLAPLARTPANVVTYKFDHF